MCSGLVSTAVALLEWGLQQVQPGAVSLPAEPPADGATGTRGAADATELVEGVQEQEAEKLWEMVMNLLNMLSSVGRSGGGGGGGGGDVMQRLLSCYEAGSAFGLVAACVQRHRHSSLWPRLLKALIKESYGMSLCTNVFIYLITFINLIILITPITLDRVMHLNLPRMFFAVLT